MLYLMAQDESSGLLDALETIYIQYELSDKISRYLTGDKTGQRLAQYTEIRNQFKIHTTHLFLHHLLQDNPESCRNLPDTNVT